jgi:hypothetical protein
MPLFGTRGAASVTGFGGLAANSLGYLLSNSLRFRSSNSAYLSRTLTAPTNNKIWTWSAWVKRSGLSADHVLLGTTDDNTAEGNLSIFRLQSQNNLSFVNYAGGYQIQLTTTQLFRDPAAWYHIVLAVDTTQATASNRVKMYVNGSQVTAFSQSTYPSQNYNTIINSAQLHYQGCYNNASSGTLSFFNGYLAAIHFIDGQQLTPSSLGSTDVTTGAWRPKEYTGTYGNNGYYLPFTNTTSTSTLGNDFSGNGDNWTVNNFSLTAGATYDSMTDVPTLGPLASNYATLNPLDSYAAALSNGNLKFSDGSGNVYQAYSTMSNPNIAIYKFYCEVTVDAGYLVGIVPESKSAAAGSTDRTNVLGYYSNGNKYNGASASAYGASFTSGDVIGIAVGNGQVEFYKNNVSQGVAFSSLTGGYKFATWAAGSAGIGCSFNFGQRPFTYTPPSGFKNLNTYNLP